MTAVAEWQAGVYDMDEATYHADPVPGGSLSSTGARQLLPPSCPARYRWLRDHPEHKDEFDFGTAAHRLVLGVGRPLAVLDAPDWRTKDAREWRDGVRAEGSVPLLKADHERVQAMADAIRAHPLAKALLSDRGLPEQSLFWERDGIWKRARLDWMPKVPLSGRPIVTDYKTSKSADPGTFARSAAAFGYHVQAAHYLEGWEAIHGTGGAAFVFIVQEKEPPYMVTVCQLDEHAIAAGRDRCRLASEIFRDCTEAGAWPGYSDDVELISLPAWATGDYL